MNKSGTFKVGTIFKAQNMRRFEICVGRSHEKLLFSDFRILLTKTQHSSGIPSKVQI